MEMKNVKEIIIPDYRYRELEYIHFNGAEKLATNFYAGTMSINHQSEFTIDSTISSGDRYYLAFYDNDLVDNLKRLYLGHLGSLGFNVNIGNT